MQTRSGFGLLLLGVVVAIAGARIGYVVYERQKTKAMYARERIKYPGANMPKVAAMNWWSSRDFTSLPDERAVEAIAARLKVSAPQLENERVQAGRQSVARFLLAYSSGAFDDYLRFISPSTEPEFDEQIVSYVRAMLVREGVLREDEPPLDPTAIMRTYWERGDGRTEKGASRFRGHITGVAMEECRLTIYDSAEDFSDATINARASSARPTAGYLAYRRSTRLRPEAKDILSAHGGVEFMEAYLILRTKKPDHPHGISIWFYWDRDKRIWLPRALVELSMYHRNARSMLVF